MSDSWDSVLLNPRIVDAQQAYRTDRLALYDTMVIRLFCRLVWRCPPSAMLRMYNRGVGSRHLDIGPGTGYFLDRCRFPATRPEICLLDLNKECLEMSARRLARYQPSICQTNLLDPLPLSKAHFDSAAMNLVLHTIPGSWASKGKIFKQVAETLRPGGILFGTTVLAEGVRMNALTRRLLAEQYRRGNFQNQGDDPDGLAEQLRMYFPSSKVIVRGNVGMFRATAG